MGLRVVVVTRSEGRTRSANESNSCPISDDFPRQRATLPSKKSKNSPNGMNPSAAHMYPYSDGGPMQYFIEEKMDIIPQKPVLPLL